MLLKEIIEDLADYIDFRRQEGDISVSLDPGTVAALTPERKPRTETAAAGQQAPRPPKRAAAKSPAPDTTRPIKMTPAPDNLTPEQRLSEMMVLSGRISRCNRCSLQTTRKQTVPGQGCLNCEIMFIGDAPNAAETEQRKAFVGPEGELLSRMLQKMGYTRDHVFMTHMLKCKPENPTPSPEELKGCIPILQKQIRLIKPKVLVALGESAAQTLSASKESIEELRGSWHDYQGIPLIATHHPAHLLKTPAARHETWADMQQVLSKTGA